MPFEGVTPIPKNEFRKIIKESIAVKIQLSEEKEKRFNSTEDSRKKK